MVAGLRNYKRNNMERVILHRISSANAREEEIVVDLDAVTAAMSLNGRTELWIGERSIFVTEGLNHFKPVTAKAKVNHVNQLPVEEVKVPEIEPPKVPAK